MWTDIRHCQLCEKNHIKITQSDSLHKKTIYKIFPYKTIYCKKKSMWPLIKLNYYQQIIFDFMIAGNSEHRNSFSLEWVYD